MGTGVLTAGLLGKAWQRHANGSYRTAHYSDRYSLSIRNHHFL